MRSDTGGGGASGEIREEEQHAPVRFLATNSNTSMLTPRDAKEPYHHILRPTPTHSTAHPTTHPTTYPTKASNIALNDVPNIVSNNANKAPNNAIQSNRTTNQPLFSAFQRARSCGVSKVHANVRLRELLATFGAAAAAAARPPPDAPDANDDAREVDVDDVDEEPAEPSRCPNSADAPAGPPADEPPPALPGPPAMAAGTLAPRRDREAREEGPVAGSYWHRVLSKTSMLSFSTRCFSFSRRLTYARTPSKRTDGRTGRMGWEEEEEEKRPAARPQGPKPRAAA
jgi:hypothetical protein